MKQKVAIIGSNSFIAKHVIDQLHKQDYIVIGLQRSAKVMSYLSSSKSGGYNPEEYFDNFIIPDQIYYGDIKDYEIVERVVSQADYVINLAGILGTSETVNNPFPAVEVNIIGTLNVLQACRIWNKPFLQIAVGNHWMNNTYSITRTTAERFTLMYAKEHGLKANIVRALNAYGPGQKTSSYKKIIPTFIKAALKNEPIKIYGDGEQKMDMIFVRDLANCLVDTLLNPTLVRNDLDLFLSGKELKINVVDDVNWYQQNYGNVYQCGSGEGPTVNEIAQTIIDLCSSKSMIEHTNMRAGEPKNAVVVADYTSPFYKTSLKDGLLETIKYYESIL